MSVAAPRGPAHSHTRVTPRPGSSTRRVTGTTASSSTCRTALTPRDASQREPAIGARPTIDHQTWNRHTGLRAAPTGTKDPDTMRCSPVSAGACKLNGVTPGTAETPDDRRDRGRGQAGAELPAADEQLLRELTERARSNGLKLTGEGGLLGRLTEMMTISAMAARPGRPGRPPWSWRRKRTAAGS